MGNESWYRVLLFLLPSALAVDLIQNGLGKDIFVKKAYFCIHTVHQCTGSGLDPDSLMSLDPVRNPAPDPGGQKMTHRNRKK